MIGVSPTYLSKVERDEFPPPVEDKVKAIAKIINCDTDELSGPSGPGVRRTCPTSSSGIRDRAGGTVADNERPDGRRHGKTGSSGTAGEGQVTA